MLDVQQAERGECHANENHLPWTKMGFCLKLTIFFLATAEKKCAIVLLELFGNFRFSVLLSDAWSGESLAKVHVINPITHERSDQDLPPTDTIYDEIQKQTDAQQIEAVKTAITTAGAVINRRQREAMVSQIVGKAFNDQESEPDRVVSEAELTTALEKISAEVARFITRSPLKENIDLTAFIHDSEKNDSYQMLVLNPSKPRRCSG